jgi:hypothetical protein
MPAAASGTDRRKNRGAPVFNGVSKAVRHEGRADVERSRCRGLLRRARLKVEPNRRVDGISSTDARSCVQLRSLLGWSVSKGYTTTLRDGHEPPQHSRTFLTGPRGRQGRPAAPPLQALPGQKRPTGHGKPIPSRSRRTGAPQASAHGGNRAGRDRGYPGPRWVRAASETAGPRRARAVTTSEPESQAHAIHRHDLGGEAAWRRVRTPPLTAARLFGCLPRGSWSPESGLIVRPSWWLSPPHRAKFVLSGSAPGKGEGGPAGAGVTR